MKKATRSGYVAFLGAPNAGKSTLLNRILGEKISIVTHKAQTTQRKLAGVYTQDECQIVFLDVPGIHDSPKQLNQFMMSEVMSAISDADVLVWLIDPLAKPSDAVLKLRRELGAAQKKKPQMLLMTKKDLLTKALPPVSPFGQETESGPMPVYLVSAKTGEGLGEWLRDLSALIPEGPFYYDAEQLSGSHLRDMACEIIREKCLLNLHDEIPYSLAVVMESFKEEEGLTRIQATLVVEQQSQKGIVIGAGGQTLKRIGTAARQDIEKLLDAKVFLGLRVKVDKGWSKEPKKLAKYGYTPEKKQNNTLKK